ncbi:hypothetical protein PENFLA_c031G08858 [Penicillium flavigenum]|uniref:Uncharacterized protein n=1 Tax=Penicillium flavigenum TaxID=254877 RepID=A0A1V6SNJ6_9EURO|nr:hypothetical protein PENFLA_c031G08858 [Penicillium flavigenum]
MEKGKEVVDLEGTPESSNAAISRAERTRKPPSYYSDIEYDRGGNPRATTSPSPPSRNPLAHGSNDNEGESSQARTVQVGDLEPQNEDTYSTEEEVDDDDDNDDGEDVDLSTSLRESGSSSNKQKAPDSEELDQRMKWEHFADSTQPDDQTRYEMALLSLPLGKVWGPDDLRDPKHPLYFKVALRLLYNKLRGSRGLHLNTSILIPYSEISSLHQNKLEETYRRPFY